MTHPRKAIRDKVVALLIAASTDAGSVVHESRSLPSGAKVPSLNVLTAGDARADVGEDPIIDLSTRRIDRSVELVIEARVSQASGADDALDDLCRQVELAMHNDATLTGSILFHQYEDTQLEPANDLDPPGHLARIRYSLVYQENWT